MEEALGLDYCARACVPTREEIRSRRFFLQMSDVASETTKAFFRAMDVSCCFLLLGSAATTNATGLNFILFFHCLVFLFPKAVNCEAAVIIWEGLATSAAMTPPPPLPLLETRKIHALMFPLCCAGDGGNVLPPLYSGRHKHGQILPEEQLPRGPLQPVSQVGSVVFRCDVMWCDAT